MNILTSVAETSLKIVWKKGCLSATSQRQQRHGLIAAFRGASLVEKVSWAHICSCCKMLSKHWVRGNANIICILTRLVFNVLNKYHRVQRMRRNAVPVQRSGSAFLAASFCSKVRKLNACVIT